MQRRGGFFVLGNFVDMAQRKDQRENDLVKLIKRYKWKRWQHIDWEIVGFARSTAYVHGLEQSDAIKEALAANRMKAVNSMLDKWIESDNPTLQIAAMKMCADEEDRMALNHNQTKATPITEGDRSEIVLPNGTKIII